jgi:hypothetical protein
MTPRIIKLLNHLNAGGFYKFGDANLVMGEDGSIGIEALDTATNKTFVLKVDININALVTHVNRLPEKDMLGMAWSTTIPRIIKLLNHLNAGGSYKFGAANLIMGEDGSIGIEALDTATNETFVLKGDININALVTHVNRLPKKDMLGMAWSTTLHEYNNAPPLRNHRTTST